MKIDENYIYNVKDDIYKFKLIFRFKKYDKIVNNKPKSSIYGKLIKFKTKSIYYHSEVIVGDIFVSTDLATGMVIRKVVSDDFTTNRYDTIVKDISLTKSQLEYLYSWLDSIKDAKYDITGILFSQLLPLRYDSKNKWFCSELAIKIGQLCYVPELMNVIPHLYSPGGQYELLTGGKK